MKTANFPVFFSGPSSLFSFPPYLVINDWPQRSPAVWMTQYLPLRNTESIREPEKDQCCQYIGKVGIPVFDAQKKCLMTNVPVYTYLG